MPGKPCGWPTARRHSGSRNRSGRWRAALSDEPQSRGGAWYSISGGPAGVEGVPGNSNLGTE